MNPQRCPCCNSPLMSSDVDYCGSCGAEFDTEAFKQKYPDFKRDLERSWRADDY